MQTEENDLQGDSDMQYRCFGNIYIIRMDRWEEVISSLTDLYNTEHIAGDIVRHYLQRICR